jgi:predicted naringenin-chalcone synthase
VSFVVEGIGTALPEHRLTQDEAVELHATFCRFDEREARTLRALYRRSGVETRHSVLLEGSDGDLQRRQTFYPPAEDDDDRGPTTLRRMERYERHAPALAVSAAREALDGASLDVGEITHLVTVSCTGFLAPGVDAAIVETLGLSRAVRRTHVGFMGCHGALNGLRVADSFAGRDPDAVCLVCAVELCTLHFSYEKDPDLLVANALFSDGAAAVAGRSSAAGRSSTGRSSTAAQGASSAAGRSSEGGDGEKDGGKGDAWRVAATGTALLPGSEDAMTWRIGDHGFRMTLSPQVPDLIEANVRGWVTGWLAGHGLDLDDIGSWAIHPGGPRVLSSVARALDLSDEATAASSEILSECGNMSSATVLFILERLGRRGAPAPCVALAFGPGLAVEATLLT